MEKDGLLSKPSCFKSEAEANAWFRWLMYDAEFGSDVEFGEEDVAGAHGEAVMWLEREVYGGERRE